MPVEVTTLRIEYFQNGALRGLGRVPTTLSPGQTFVINDPPFDDVDAVLTGLSVEPPTAMGAGLYFYTNTPKFGIP